MFFDRSNFLLFSYIFPALGRVGGERDWSMEHPGGIGSIRSRFCASLRPTDTNETNERYIYRQPIRPTLLHSKGGLVPLLRDFTTTTGWRSEHLLPNHNRACLHQRIYTGSRSFPALRSTSTTTNVQSRLPRCKFTLYLLSSTPVFVRARDGCGCIYSPYTAVSVLSFLCLFLFYVCTLCWDPWRCWVASLLRSVMWAALHFGSCC